MGRNSKMYKMYLSKGDCISCGICNDVCDQYALSLTQFNGAALEGSPFFPGNKFLSVQKESFPFLKFPGKCNGCMDCVKECPTLAINIYEKEEAAPAENYKPESK